VQLYLPFSRYVASLAFSQIKETQAGKYTLSVISETGNYTVVVPILIRSKYILYEKGHSFNRFKGRGSSTIKAMKLSRAAFQASS